MGAQPWSRSPGSRPAPHGGSVAGRADQVLRVHHCAGDPTATLVGDELVLTMLNGTEHSRISVDHDINAAETRERLSNATRVCCMIR